MEETIKIVGQYGGLVAMAGLFVWSYLKDRTKNDAVLARVDKTNENIAKSIDAINNTTSVLKDVLLNHDERAKRIEDSVENIKIQMLKK